MIYIVSLWIGTWITYHFFNKSPICNLNAIFDWKLAKLLLGVITVEKLNIRLWGYYYISILVGFQHKTINLSTFLILPPYFFHISHWLPFPKNIYCSFRMLPFSTAQLSLSWIIFMWVIQDICLLLYIHFSISKNHHIFSSLYCYVFQ